MISNPLSRLNRKPFLGDVLALFCCSFVWRNAENKTYPRLRIYVIYAFSSRQIDYATIALQAKFLFQSMGDLCTAAGEEVLISTMCSSVYFVIPSLENINLGSISQPVGHDLVDMTQFLVSPADPPMKT